MELFAFNSHLPFSWPGEGADGTPGGRRRADLRKSFSFFNCHVSSRLFLSPSFLSLSASLIILLVAEGGDSGWPGRELPFEVSLFQRRRRLLLLLYPSLLFSLAFFPAHIVRLLLAPPLGRLLSFTGDSFLRYQGATSFLSRHSPGDALSLRTFLRSLFLIYSPL